MVSPMSARLGVGYQVAATRKSLLPGPSCSRVEPAVAVPGTGTEAPVIFPGYVLPDDSREDSVHEGS